MASQADVRRIALSLPEASAGADFGFSVGGKAFAWPWRERIDPRRGRVPNPEVLAVRVANELEKQALLSPNADQSDSPMRPAHQTMPIGHVR
jgi:hypothetical protein